MSDIAERAGVNPTTLYRRWGDAGLLATEVAIERLTREFPIPDTGSLRGDLLVWAKAATRSLGSKKNLALLRILAAGAQTGEQRIGDRLAALSRRTQDLAAMLERAGARGEATPDLFDLLEVVLAPIYYRALFFGMPGSDSDAERYVDRVLKLASSSPSPRPAHRSAS